MIIRSLFLFLSFALFLFGESYQLGLKKNVWNLIGVNGYHINAINVSPISGWTLIKDSNDSEKVTTWDMIDESTVNTTATPDTGDKLYSTLGIKIESDSNANLESVIINYNKKSKDTSKFFYSMFVSSDGSGRKADIKITYQSSYEGEKFYLTFNDSTTETFVGTFSKLNTREEPLGMDIYKSDEIDKIKNILNTFDMNLSDNNISNLSNLNIYISTENYSETGGRQIIEPDDNLSVYKWNGASAGSGWEIFNKNNPINDFSDFEPGYGYWVKLDTSKNDPIGLILGEGDINETTYSDELNLVNGWNLLSFDDSYIRYVPSAVFLPLSEFAGSGFVIRDNFKNDTLIVPTYLSYSDINVSAYINNTMNVADKNGSFSWYLRSYPAKDNSGNSGIILISDEPFEINASASVLSVSGQSLVDENFQDEEVNGVLEKQRMYQTRIDEFLLAVKPNFKLFNDSPDTLVNDKKAGFSFNMPTVSGSSFKIDLSSDGNISDIVDSIGQSLGINGKVYMLDYNLSNEYSLILIAGMEKFYVRDTTTIRLYEYNNSVAPDDYKLSYSNGIMANLTSATNIYDTVNNINIVSPTTNIRAFVVDNDKNRFLLMSNVHQRFSLKELGDSEQFTEIELDSDNNESVKGAFSDVINGTELARTKIIDINETQIANNWNVEWQDIVARNTTIGVPGEPIVIKKDLAYTPIWAPDFPTDGPLYKLKDLNGNPMKVNYILSGITREDETIYWRQADTTMDPYLWKSNLQRFNLFKLHKNRGYWVYLDSVNAEINSIVISEPNIKKTITRSFNNLFDVNGSNQVSKIDNRQRISFEVSIDGFDLSEIGSEQGQKAENVNVNIDGEVIPLLKNGTSYNYIAELTDYEFISLREKEKPSLKSGLLVVASDGKGNRKEKEIIYDNQKPTAPEYSFEDDATDAGQGFFGGLRFVFDDNLTLSIYDGNLSDYTSNSSKLIKPSEELTIPDGDTFIVHHVNPLDGSYISYGTATKPYYDLRLISYRDNNLWSDMRRVYYAPVYKNTHIIEADESGLVGNNPDYLPVAFDSVGQNPVNYTESGIQVNSGVELLLDDGDANDDNITVTMAYKPITGAKFDSGIPRVVYFDDNTTNGYVGRLTYSQLYEGDVFYMYSNETNTTYYQVFPNVDMPSTNPLELIPIDSNQSFYKPSI